MLLMANDEHVARLKQGVDVWNEWLRQNRRQNLVLSEEDLRQVESLGARVRDLGEADLGEADLSRADLSRANLSGVNFSGANLSGANLSGANLSEADLGGANLSEADLGYSEAALDEAKNLGVPEYALAEARLDGEATITFGANLKQAHLSEANLRGANLHGADLRGAKLYGAQLSDANLWQAHLSEANLSGAELSGANLREADLSRADLSGANLSGANLSGANLSGANLRGARLGDANLQGADFHGADLNGADLSQANLHWAHLSEANLQGANLYAAHLLDTDFTGANLTGCRIFGISAWRLKLEGAKQQSLVITPHFLGEAEEPEITVDNIEVAQFIYLMLHNQKIRDVIDTIGKKGVLLLGRFTDERKAVLDALREELRKHNYLPILFDFDVPAALDITETVSLLARMARFIIADLTDPSSIPKELEAIVPGLAVPVQPLLEGSARPYAMFKDYWKYEWVLPVYRYEGLEGLLAALAERVIAPAKGKVKALEERRRIIEAELTKPP